LPEESLFTLDDYLEMYRIASSRPGFAILTLLQTEGRLSTNELSEALNRESNKLHYHLRKLKDTALIRNRRDPNTGNEDVYSYYMLTDLGHTVLTQGVKTGVEKLAAEEHDIQEQYSK
jgi:predicted transcriptional regulator